MGTVASHQAGRPPRSAVARLVRLPAADLMLTIRSLVEFCAVEVCLRLLPLTQAARVLRVRLDLGPAVDSGAAPARRPALPPPGVRRARAARRVGRHWPFAPGPCLREAIVTCRLLRRWSPVTRLGVAARGGGVLAHAWVEIDGASLERSDGFAAFGDAHAV